MLAPVELADMAEDVLARIRSRAPRVHCLTNSVAQQYTANMLLAAGAVPSMTVAPEEVGAFVASADALLVNLGTFDAERRAAVELAVAAAGERRLPWLLDPVFIDRSPARAQFARKLVAGGPRAIRLNAAEFETLAGGDGPTRFAHSRGAVVALTGDVDVVTDGERRAAIASGHPLMGVVTAMGCAGSALVCAGLAVEADAWLATTAALTAFAVAGEVAADQARGPGSFAGAIIDALYRLDGATLRARARIS